MWGGFSCLYPPQNQKNVSFHLRAPGPSQAVPPTPWDTWSQDLRNCFLGEGQGPTGSHWDWLEKQHGQSRAGRQKPWHSPPYLSL